MTINWSVNTHEHLASTQDTLKEMVAVNGAYSISEGTVIHAIQQDSGRGRHGRVWESELVNLTFSFIIKPNCDISNIGQIAILCGLSISNAVVETISENYKCVLKWPNDILINDRKCSGILIDAAPAEHNKVPYFIIGVGINVTSSPLAEATCLKNHTDDIIDPEKFMKDVLSSFSDIYTQWKSDGFDDVRSKWIEKTYNIGREVSVKIGSNHVKGYFHSIDTYGNLVIICAKEDKKIKITSGEVFLL